LGCPTKKTVRPTIKLEGEYSEQHQIRNVMTHKGVAKRIPSQSTPNAECVSRDQTPERAAQSRLVTASPPLEAVQASLLLLALVDGIHTLLKLAAGSLGSLSLLALLLHSLKTPSVVLNRLRRRAVLELLDLYL
jgi:hypothetical protein